MSRLVDRIKKFEQSQLKEKETKTPEQQYYAETIWEGDKCYVLRIKKDEKEPAHFELVLKEAKPPHGKYIIVKWLEIKQNRLAEHRHFKDECEKAQIKMPDVWESIKNDVRKFEQAFYEVEEKILRGDIKELKEKAEKILNELEKIVADEKKWLDTREILRAIELCDELTLYPDIKYQIHKALTEQYDFLSRNLKYIITHALEEAKKRNIWLLKATEELTPLIF